MEIGDSKRSLLFRVNARTGTSIFTDVHGVGEWSLERNEECGKDRIVIVVVDEEGAE